MKNYEKNRETIKDTFFHQFFQAERNDCDICFDCVENLVWKPDLASNYRTSSINLYVNYFTSWRRERERVFSIADQLSFNSGIHERDDSRVPRSARALAASAVSAVDTHRSSWHSDCTDWVLLCDKAGSGCTSVSIRSQDEEARSSVVSRPRTSNRCRVDEDKPRD